MQTRTIGSLEVSLVGLGCNNFGGRLDEAQTKRVVDATAEVVAPEPDEGDLEAADRPCLHGQILTLVGGRRRW
jgi:hypothetical protein